MKRILLLIIIAQVIATQLVAQPVADNLREVAMLQSGEQLMFTKLKLVKHLLVSNSEYAQSMLDELSDWAEQNENKDVEVQVLKEKIAIACEARNIKQAETLNSRVNYLARRSGNSEYLAIHNYCKALISKAKEEKNAADLFDEAIKYADAHQQYIVASQAANTLASIYRSAGINDKWQGSILRAVEYDTKHNDYAQKATTYNALGSYCWNMGQYSKALDNYRKALELRKSCGTVREVVNSLVNVGLAYRNMGDYTQAAAYYKKALSVVNKYQGSGSRAEVYNHLGAIYWRKNVYDSALMCYRIVADIYKADSDYVKLANLYDNIGNTFKISDQYDSVLHYYNMALQLRSEIEGADLALSYANIGSAYWKMTMYSPALNSYYYALTSYQNANDTLHIASTLNNIGMICREMNDLTNAFLFHKQAMVLYDRLNDKVQKAVTYNHLGNTYILADSITQALNSHMEALRLRQETNDLPSVANSLVNLGRIYKDIGDFEKSESFLREALATYKSIGNQRYVAYAYNHLGDMFVSKKQADFAEQQYQASLSLFEKEKDRLGCINSLWLLGKLCNNIGKGTRAIGYLQKSYGLAKELNNTDFKQKTVLELSKAYELVGDNANALKYMKLCTQLKDSIFEDHTRQHTTKYQADYDVSILQHTIKSLQQTSQKAVNKIDVQRANLQLLFVVLLLLLVLSTILAVRLLKRKHSDKQLYRSIISTINDARTIVNSIVNHLKVYSGGDVDFSESDYANLQRDVQQLKFNAMLILRNVKLAIAYLNGETKPQMQNETISNETLQMALLSEIQHVNDNKFEFECEPEAVTYCADNEIVALVVDNFIANAIACSKTGDRIVVSAKALDTQIVISVNGACPPALSYSGWETIEIGNDEKSRSALRLRFCQYFASQVGGRIEIQSVGLNHATQYLVLKKGK